MADGTAQRSDRRPLGDRCPGSRRAAARRSMARLPRRVGYRSVPFCEGRERPRRDELLAFRATDTLPNHAGLAGARGAEQVSRAGCRCGDCRTDAEASSAVDDWFRSCRPTAPTRSSSNRRGIVESTDRTADAEVVEVFRGVSRPAAGAEERSRACGYGMIFKNVGAGRGVAGAHAQPADRLAIVPINVRPKRSPARGVLPVSGPVRLLRHDPAGAGGRAADRADTTGWSCLCPFASRFPFETWILPKRPRQPLRDIDSTRKQWRLLPAWYGRQLLEIEAVLDRRPTITSFTRPPLTRSSLGTITGI